MISSQLGFGMVIGKMIPSGKYEICVNWDDESLPTEWKNKVVMFQSPPTRGTSPKLDLKMRLTSNGQWYLEKCARTLEKKDKGMSSHDWKLGNDKHANTWYITGKIL